jgi:hypothetical protein
MAWPEQQQEQLGQNSIENSLRWRLSRPELVVQQPIRSQMLRKGPNMHLAM